MTVDVHTFRRKIAAVHFCCPPQEKQTRQPIELRHEKKIGEKILLLPSSTSKSYLAKKNETSL